MSMKPKMLLAMLIIFSIIVMPLNHYQNELYAHQGITEKRILLTKNMYPVYYLPSGSDTLVLDSTSKAEINTNNELSAKAAGIIVLEFYVSRTEYMPYSEGTVEFVIQNALDEAINVSIDIRIPYFIEIKENKVHWERNATSGDSEWLFGVPLEFSNLEPEEKLNITFNLVGKIGKREEGKLVINVYDTNTGELFLTRDEVISARPAFTAEAEFNPFLLNISKTNMTTLVINITNDASYEITDIDIELREVPSDLFFEKYTVQVNKIGVRENITVKINATIAKPGVYQIAVLINSTVGQDVIRPNLLVVTKKVIIFDEGHNQYYRFASEYMNELIELAREFAPVIISRQAFRGNLFTTDVTQLIIIPCPQPATADPEDTTSPIFDEDEIITLQNFIENGGSILLMGNWYRYFWPDNPYSFNDLTNRYGIYWWDGDVYDTVSYDQAYYHVIAKVFADNEVAKIISLGIDEVHFAGTAFKIITPSVPTEIYPVLLGNENYTFLTLGGIDDPKVAEGTDVIMMLAAVVKGVGKIFASGSSYVFSSYYYFDQNEQLIRNILTWLMGVKKLDLSISGVPFEINIGEEIIADVTIMNRGVENIRDIELSLSLSPGLINKNGTNTYSIALLRPGEQIRLKWIITANKEGTYSITFSLVASNYPESITKRLLVTYRKPMAHYPLEIIITSVIMIIAIIIIVSYAFMRKRGMIT